MHCVNKMALSSDIKPEIIDLEDTESIESSKQGLDATPEWILVFTKELLKINGQRCPEKLDRMMGEYLELMRIELMKCQISPNRSYHIASKMQKFLAYFYGYYQDIREYFVVTRWNENVVELMAIYSYLELKAAIRLKRRETDQALASRIFKMLYLYFEGNEEHIIHTFLKTPMSNLKCKSIYDLIFRKVLVTNRTNRAQTHTDLEYIRNLLCFKIWKTLYPKSEKQIVTNYALSHNKPPSNLSNYIRKFRFIPKAIDHSDLHNKLCTIPLQIDDGIREYFERLESKNGKHFGSVKSKDKKTFISRLFDVFSNIGSTSDDVGDSFMDNLLLDQIKTETEELRFEEDENSDDDCIYVDPNEPAPPPPVVEPPQDILIDLTNNEPDTDDGEPNDLTPTWCVKLLNQLNTNKEPLNTVCEPEKICKPIEIDYETVNNKLKECELVQKLTDCQPVNVESVSSVLPVVSVNEMDCELVKKSTDCEPVKTTDCAPINQRLSGFETEPPVVNGFKTVHLQKDCEPVSSKDFQPVNGTIKHCKPVDIPKLNSAIVNPVDDFESENCKTDSQTIHNIDEEPEYLQPMDCEPVINSKPVSSNIINGYSVKDTDFDDFETVNNNVKSSTVEPVNTTVICEPVEHERDTTINSLEVEDYLNDLQTESEFCEPVIRNINRENINKTPLDIIDDFCASEDEYSLPEITSTSHDYIPVQSSVQTRENMQSPTTGNKTPNAANNWDQSFDKADSTSNFTESTITPFFVEENESFAKHSTNHSIDMIVSTPKAHDLSKLVPQLDQSDSLSETSSIEGNLVINSNNAVLDDRADADEVSPVMEPISGNDYADYLSSFEQERYSEYQKDTSAPNLELVVNKNVKIRTYKSFKPRPKPVPVDEPPISVLEPECRVPVNGEKVLRFETELWEPVFLQTFKLSKKEYQLFNPQVKVCKSDKRDYGIFDDLVEPGLLYGGSGTAVKGGCSAMDALHAPVYNTAKTKTILERQDYVKDEKQTRALVQTRPLRSKSVSRKCGEAPKQPTNQAKKRGIDLNLFSSPDVSASLNNSFQHHFCSDISTCSSNCYSPTLSAQLDTGPNYPSQFNPQFNPNHLNFQLKTTPNPLIVPNYPNLSDKIPQTAPSNPMHPQSVQNPQICGKLPIPPHPQFNLRVGDEFAHPQLKSTIHPNLTDKIPQTAPSNPMHPQSAQNSPNPHFNLRVCDEFAHPQLKSTILPNLSDKIPQTAPNSPIHPQICDKLPITPNPQYNLRVCDEFVHPQVKSAPMHPNLSLEPVPKPPSTQYNPQIHVNVSQSNLAGLNHPSVHFNERSREHNAIPIQSDLNHPSTSLNHPSSGLNHPKCEFNADTVPLPAPIPDLNTYWQSVDPDQLVGTNLSVNINLDQSNADHEIHLPIKKRRVSSLKVEIKDELSYPCTPMISIAELESIKTEQRNLRPFKTPAELKEVPPLPPSYLLTVPNHMVSGNLNINHTFNNPIINYLNNVPVINFHQYHQPILVPNWQQPGYSYVPPSGKGVTTTATGKKRNSRATERKKAKTKS